MASVSSSAEWTDLCGPCSPAGLRADSERLQRPSPVGSVPLEVPTAPQEEEPAGWLTLVSAGRTDSALPLGAQGAPGEAAAGSEGPPSPVPARLSILAGRVAGRGCPRVCEQVEKARSCCGWSVRTQTR